MSAVLTSVPAMATFVTGIHHCPDCHEEHTGSRSFVEQDPNGATADWCSFVCPNGHIWARPGTQAVH